jgi:hypothetical protein
MASRGRAREFRGTLPRNSGGPKSNFVAPPRNEPGLLRGRGPLRLRLRAEDVQPLVEPVRASRTNLISWHGHEIRQPFL